MVRPILKENASNSLGVIYKAVEASSLTIIGGVAARWCDIDKIVSQLGMLNFKLLSLHLAENVKLREQGCAFIF